MSFLGLFDYPKEIKQLESQIPAKDRAAFLSRYKKLSKNDKTSFKQALRSADIDTANRILGGDLNQYYVTLTKQAANTNAKTVTGIKGVNQLNEKPVTPTILPAEASRRYAASFGSTPATLSNLATTNNPAKSSAEPAIETAVGSYNTATPSAGATVTAIKGVKKPVGMKNISVINQLNEKPTTPTILPAEASRRYAASSDSTPAVLNNLATTNNPAESSVEPATETAVGSYTTYS